jgi:glycosyltransferase involved in cell wall biosynthesis
MNLKLSIVTVNYNYGHFLEETILSVLNQGYENLEYIIIDGGSTDNSVEIIKKYEDRLAFWSSEKDNGIYDALNKGFSKCTGDIMAYINSDDVYLPWSFDTVTSVFAANPSINWISTLQPGYIDYVSRNRWFDRLPGFSKRAFLDGVYAGRYSKYRFIQQESTFWRKNLWEHFGGKINTDYELAGDFYLWNEFYKYSVLYGLNVPLGLFRLNHKQKSGQIERYIEECHTILKLNNAVSYLCLDFRTWVGVFVRRVFNKNRKYDGDFLNIVSANNSDSYLVPKQMSFTLNNFDRFY